MSLLEPYSQTIATLQSRNPNNLEVEVRFGNFIQNHQKKIFNPGIDQPAFSRLQRLLNRISKPTIQQTTEAIKNDQRRITYQDGSISWVNKKKLYYQDIPEYAMRLVASREQPIEPPTNFQPDLTRNKLRYSYPLGNGAARVDLTRVDSQSKITFEVEIELLVARGFQAFSKATELILKTILNTYLLYTQEDRKEVTAYFNLLLTGRDDDHQLNFNVVSSARPLKIQDLVDGGLVGNPKTGYVVYHQAEGERRLLLFAPNGIWLVMPPNGLTRLSDERNQATLGTILDGYLVAREDRQSTAPKVPYWYLTFDLLAWQGDRNSAHLPHRDRMELVQSVANRIESSLLQVTTMSFVSFNTSEEFFEVMRQMFRQKPSLPYQSSGLVFKPETANYQPVVTYEGQLTPVKNLPLSQRVLTRFPDIVKWKSPTQLRVSLVIRRNQQNHLELTARQGGQLVKFTGTSLYPFSGELTQIPPLLQEVFDNSVVEFQIDGDNPELLTPLRIRLDKNYPDQLEMVEATWSEFYSPVTEATLQGKSLDLLAHYLSRVRKSLYRSASREEATLLVLNGGRGEDLSSWWQYAKVVVFEDNRENQVELIRRIQLSQLDRRVRLVTSWSEIVPTVQEFLGQADVIALVNQLGSFWQSPADLEKLEAVIEATLSSLGEIIFLGLDGSAVVELFHPVFTPAFQVKYIEDGLSPVSISYLPDQNQLITNYRESHLKDTVENPAFIYNLIYQLSLNLTEIHQGDTEKFLTLFEKILGRLYSFGLISRNKLSLAEGKASFTVAKQQSKVITPKPVLAPLVKARPVKKPLKQRPIPRKIPPTPREWPLRTLPVFRPKTKGAPGIGEDKSERLKVSWTSEEVFRIACIGDGSCFFHVFLKGFYDKYQNNPSFDFRSQLVRAFRDELVILIQEPDPNNPGKTYYQTAAGGSWVRMAEQQAFLEEPFTDDYGVPIDYSLNGMIQLLSSDRDIGDEVYKFVADVIGVDIYVTRGTNRDLYLQILTGVTRPAVVIVGNGHHYELVVVKREGAYQSLFDPNDEFLHQLRNSERLS